MAEEYSDPRLVDLYDLLNPWGPDLDFYAALALPSDRRVLDMGCGTGLLATAFARAGLEVVGADPAPAMLAAARARHATEQIEWVEADAAGFHSDVRFDLVTMAGHVYQLFLDDTAARAALTNLRRHLAPGGRVAFETRHPAAQAWRHWTPEVTRLTVSHPDHGDVTAWIEVPSVEGELVHFTVHYRFDDGTVAMSPHTLRFPPPAAVFATVRASGLQISEAHGDWDRSPLTEASPEIIVVARK